MDRKRGGLTSIGEAISGVEGPVKELREVSPQALHHFTRFDQVNQLVGASEADPDTGFMARLMALCSLPRTNPGNRKEYKRVNGPYTLYMIAGGGNKLPFGNLPRLLLAWVCTEAVRTQTRVLILGSSLSGFMRELGIYHNSAGRGGVQTRLRNQMERLFRCQIELIHEHEYGKRFVASRIADSGEFWWNFPRPQVPLLWESKIELGEKFFNEIIQHPMPLVAGRPALLRVFVTALRKGQALEVGQRPDTRRCGSAGPGDGDRGRSPGHARSRARRRTPHTGDRPRLCAGGADASVAADLDPDDLARESGLVNP